MKKLLKLLKFIKYKWTCDDCKDLTHNGCLGWGCKQHYWNESGNCDICDTPNFIEKEKERIEKVIIYLKRLLKNYEEDKNVN